MFSRSRSRSLSPARRRGGGSPSESPKGRSVTGSPSPSAARSMSGSGRSARSRSKTRSRSRSFRSRSKSIKRETGPAGDRERPKPTNCLGVFGLNYSTTEEDLDKLFSKYGAIEKISLVLDGPSRKSRGFGFVYFDHVKDATKACEALNDTTLMGFKLRVDYSITKEAHKPTPGVYYHRGEALKPGERKRSSRGGGRPPHHSRPRYRPEDRDVRREGRERERGHYPDYDREYYPRTRYYKEDRYYEAPPPRREDRYRDVRYREDRYREERYREDPRYAEPRDRYYEDRYYREYDRSAYYEVERRGRRSPPPPPLAYERLHPPPRYENRERFPPTSKPRRRSASPGPSRRRSPPSPGRSRRPRY